MCFFQKIRWTWLFGLLLILSSLGNDASTPVTAELRSGGVPAGASPSIAVRSDDIPIIVSVGANTHQVRLTTCTDTLCSGQVTRNLAQTQGSASVALSPTNLARVTFLDAVRNEFRMIRCANTACSSWISHLIDATPYAGTVSQVRLTSADNPVIVYPGGDSGELRLAMCSTPTCTAVTIRTLIGAPSDPSEPSLALTGLNVPVISFYDDMTDDLKVIVCNNPTCTIPTIRTIDATGDVGHWSSIAITTTGLPVISYYDKTNNSLKLARCTATDCSTSTKIHLHRSGLFPVGGLPSQTSLVVPSTNIPVMSFYDNVTRDILSVQCNNPICVAPVITTVDAAGDVGDGHALALTRSGAALITYHDSTNETLKLYPGSRIIDRGQPSYHKKTSPLDASYQPTTSVTLSWRGVPEATSYRYCFTQVLSSCETTPGWHDVGTAKSITKSGLVHNVTYYWQVIAVNAAGTTRADNGTAWQFTVAIPPAAFSKTAPANVATNIPLTPTLTWASSERATSYEYCYATSAVTCTRWIDTSTARRVTLPALSRGTTYYWSVRARNAGGIATANSTVWRFTTIR